MALHQCSCHPNMVATSGITSNNYLCSHKLIRTSFPHTYATMALHQFYHVCLVCLFVALHHFFAFKLGDFFLGGQQFVPKVAIASQDSKPIAHHGQGVQAHEGFHEGHQEGASHELPRDHAR